MISVALATYNGEKFIKEQLDSIFKQTVLPDEIVISDDNSDDNTLKIINGYKKRAEYKKIKIIINKNKENKGYRINFYNAIKNCSGDFIFLCDQDDIWKENKIENMITEMKKNTNILLLCSNLESFYIENCQNKVHEKHYFSLKKVKKIDKYKDFVNTPRPGCTFCINKKLANIYFNKVDFSLYHDNLLWHLACINKGAYILNKKTILYRRHSSNASNNKENVKEKRIESIQNQIKSIEYILNNSNNNRVNKYMQKQKIIFKKRMKYLIENDLFNLFFMIRYIKYYNSLRLWMVDLYYCIKRK